MATDQDKHIIETRLAELAAAQGLTMKDVMIILMQETDLRLLPERPREGEGVFWLVPAPGDQVWGPDQPCVSVALALREGLAALTLRDRNTAAQLDGLIAALREIGLQLDGVPEGSWSFAWQGQVPVTGFPSLHAALTAAIKTLPGWTPPRTRTMAA